MFQPPSQLDKDGHLNHLLSIEGLNQNMIINLLDKAQSFFDANGSLTHSPLLKKKIIANLFFEPSTRTRATFELAAKRLSANVLSLDENASSSIKGESLRDTIRNLDAMQCDMFIIRHPTSGTAQFVAQEVKSGVSVINAGDGCHAHPTQALLDIFTIRKYRKDFQNLTVAIIGDIQHSRVARSQIQALRLLKTGEIRLIGPKTLIPPFSETLDLKTYHHLQEGLRGVDIIMMLRLQRERMQGSLLPPGDAYYRQYGLTEDSLKYANPEALIIHPGPINRGVEIQSELADGPHAVILDQVTNGVAVRMAVMSLLHETQEKAKKLL